MPGDRSDVLAKFARSALFRESLRKLCNRPEVKKLLQLAGARAAPRPDDVVPARAHLATPPRRRAVTSWRDIWLDAAGLWCLASAALIVVSLGILSDILIWLLSLPSRVRFKS